MKYALSLIDKASKVCGGDAALARALKMSRAAVSLMRSGERAVTPEIAAELAELAGEDARQALIDTVIERNAGTPKGPLLREILGKGVAAGVAAMWLISYSGDSLAATKSIAPTLAKSEHAIHRIYYALRRAAMAVRIRVRQILPRKRGPLLPASADLSGWSATRIVRQARMAVAPR